MRKIRDRVRNKEHTEQEKLAGRERKTKGQKKLTHKDKSSPNEPKK